MSTNNKWLLEHAANVHSQAGEDGIIAKVLDAMIGLRATESEERAGLDISLHEEQSYVLAE